MEMVHVDLIIRTNNDLNADVVAEIVREGIDSDKFGVLPAYFDEGWWIITDGNHRLAAACIQGVEYVPVAPLTKPEYYFIAFSKTRTVDLLIRVPEVLKYHNP